MSTENAATKSEIRNLRTRLKNQKSDFESKIEDVQEKVIVLKKEVDTKSDQQHEHEEYVEAGTLEDDIQQVETELKELIESLDEMNKETHSDFSEKLDKLAHNLLSNKERLENLERDLKNRCRRKEKMDKILSDARDIGTNRGVCDSCSGKIHVGRLRKPECPYCSSEIHGMRSRMLFSDVFTTEEQETQSNQL